MHHADASQAESFVALVGRMPGGGVPAVDETTGLILEFSGATSMRFDHEFTAPPLIPAPPLQPGRAFNLKSKQNIINNNDNNNNNNNVNQPKCDHKTISVREDIDVGHRHFSSLQWLYPGTFLPSRDMLAKRGVNNVYKSAMKTVVAKLTAGGGHTGWSAVWAASLLARLRRPDLLWPVLKRVMSRYSAANGLGLHPSLRPGDEGQGGECKTCYSEVAAGQQQHQQPRASVGGVDNKRGMILTDGSVVITLNMMLCYCVLLTQDSSSFFCYQMITVWL